MVTSMGFVGAGSIPDDMHVSLLDDLTRAYPADVAMVHDVNPSDRDHVYPPDFAAEYFSTHNVACTTVSDSQALVDGLVQAPGSRLYVYWDNSGHLRTLVAKALDQGIEVRDMTTCLTQIEAMNPTEEEREVVSTMQKVWTRDEIDAMSAEEQDPAARALGINPDDYGDWDDVTEAMLATQAGDDTEPTAVTRRYTRVELEEMASTPNKKAGRENLLALAKYNHIEIPGERPRNNTIIQAILDRQAEGDDSATDPVEAPVPEEGGTGYLAPVSVSYSPNMVTTNNPAVVTSMTGTYLTSAPSLTKEDLAAELAHVVAAVADLQREFLTNVRLVADAVETQTKLVVTSLQVIEVNTKKLPPKVPK